MTEPLRIALAGLGTVGAGVIRLLDANGALIARRAGRPIEIVGGLRARPHQGPRRRYRPLRLGRRSRRAGAASREADVVVELVGGSDGPALALARATLAAGKSLVTANKAMIAHHGLELARSRRRARTSRSSSKPRSPAAFR